MKTIEERIAEARADVAFMKAIGHGVRIDMHPAVYTRLLARAEKRLADLEAVRDGKAVEVHGTALVSASGAWGVYDRMLDDSFGSRLTILRAIAYLPVATTDEAEAESEEA